MNDTRLWVSDLLAQFSGQGNTLTIPRPYIEVTGSIEDALLLSQIIYWTDRTTMDNGWFAKSYSEWKDEIALSKYQVMAATKRLQAAGVETEVKKFKGAPTVHYRLRKSDFELWIVKKLDERKSRNLTIDSEETQQSSTKPTTKPTKEKVQRTHPLFTIKYPSNVHSYTIKHIEAYQGEHNGEMVALVKAWAGDMFASVTEFGKSEGQMYVEVHQELTRLNVPSTDYPTLATYAKTKNKWKSDKGDKVWVKCMLDYVTEYKPTHPPAATPSPSTNAKLAHDYEEMFGAKH